MLARPGSPPPWLQLVVLALFIPGPALFLIDLVTAPIETDGWRQWGVAFLAVAPPMLALPTIARQLSE